MSALTPRGELVDEIAGIIQDARAERFNPDASAHTAARRILDFIGAKTTGGRFDLHTIDRDYGATFRRFDAERAREVLIVVTVSQWEAWDRPVTVTAEITPGPVIVEEEPNPPAKPNPAPWARDVCHDGFHAYIGRSDTCRCGAVGADGEPR